MASVGQPLTATLTNTGSATGSISPPTASPFKAPTPAPSLSAAQPADRPLAIGANCTITVTFNSSAAGTFTGTLNVASNTAIPASVNLTGTASASAGTINLQAGTVPPSGPAINFGTVVAPTTTSAQAVVLTNTGSTTIEPVVGNDRYREPICSSANHQLRQFSGGWGILLRIVQVRAQGTGRILRSIDRDQ